MKTEERYCPKCPRILEVIKSWFGDWFYCARCDQYYRKPKKRIAEGIPQ